MTVPPDREVEMHIEFWIIFSVLLWFAVELGVRNRGVRVTLQCVFVLGLCIAAYSLGSFIGTFERNLRANNQLKNLTRSLITIADDEDFDRTVFLKRLKHLDQQVIPTYESQRESRQAVEDFLDAYDIEFEEEIPIESNEGDDV